MSILRNIIKQKPLLSYFIFTYIISWAFLIPSLKILSDAGLNQGDDVVIPPLAAIGLIGAFGPTIAAIILTLITDGKSKTLQLLKKLIIWKVHIKWYLFVLLIPSILLGVSVLISQLIGFSLGQAILTNIPIVFLSAILFSIPFGPLAEELGWRGYALPRLLNKFNPIIASLILGFLWTVWHIPMIFVPGIAIPSVFEVNILTIFLYLLSNTALSLIFTAIYIRTKGSVLLAVLLHAGSNASSNIIYYIFPTVEAVAPHRLIIYTIYVVLMSIIGLIMLKKR